MPSCEDSEPAAAAPAQEDSILLGVAGGAGGALLGLMLVPGWPQAAAGGLVWHAVLTGFLVGGLVRLAGRGTRWPFGLLAALFTLVSCLAGMTLVVGSVDLKALGRGVGSLDLAPLASRWQAHLVESSATALLGEATALFLGAGLAGILAMYPGWLRCRWESTVAPPPPAETRASPSPALARWRLAALAVFTTAALLASIVGRGERSGWILLTVPTDPRSAANTLLGYSSLYGGEPFMIENIPCVEQATWFCGSRPRGTDFRFVRGVYSFLGAHLVPVVGHLPALWLINLLSWALCALVSWRLCLNWFHDPRAAFLSVVLNAGGVGYWVHITDYNPHLLAFATYYAGFYGLAASRLAQASHPWRRHLVAGLALGFAGLIYNTGLMLTGLYALTAIRRNRFRYVFAASLLAVLQRPLWQTLLPALGIHVQDLESEYLREALGRWGALASLEGGAGLSKAARLLSECWLFIDSPVVVVLGGGALWWGARRTSCPALVWLSVGLPVLAALVFAPKATARGYIVFSATAAIYPLLGGAASRFLDGGVRQRRLGAALVGILLGAHFIWSTAHLHGHLFPVKAYFLGWDWALPLLQDGRPPVRSLTGTEPTPVLFGGGASLEAAGVVQGVPRRQLADLVSPLFAWATRFPLYLSLLALGLAWRPGRAARRRWTAVLVVVHLGGAVWAYSAVRQTPRFYEVERALELPAGTSLEYQVRLAPEYLASLRSRKEGRPDSSLRLFLRSTSPVTLTARCGGQPLRLEADLPQHWRVVEGAEVLGQAGHLTLAIEVRNPSADSVWIAGWQGAPGAARLCVRSDRRRPGVWPALEVRLQTPEGQLLQAGF